VKYDVLVFFQPQRYWILFHNFWFKQNETRIAVYEYDQSGCKITI
jgi:hypothetical protein